MPASDHKIHSQTKIDNHQKHVFVQGQDLPLKLQIHSESTPLLCTGTRPVMNTRTHPSNQRPCGNMLACASSQKSIDAIIISSVHKFSCNCNLSKHDSQAWHKITVELATSQNMTLQTRHQISFELATSQTKLYDLGAKFKFANYSETKC